MSEIRAALRQLVAERPEVGGGDLEFDRFAAVQVRDLRQYGVTPAAVAELLKRRFKFERPLELLARMTMLEIAAAIEAPPAPAPSCCQCGKPVETVIGGLGYCEAHAAALGRKRQEPKLPPAPAEKGRAA